MSFYADIIAENYLEHPIIFYLHTVCLSPQDKDRLSQRS